MIAVAELAAQLRGLGLAAGDQVMTHASLRRLGPVEGGAAGVIAAQRAVVGPRGGLLMVLGADPDEPFQAETTPVDVEDMGVLAEVFRTTPGVVVNDHPADRFGAWGEAVPLLSPSPLHDYHGPGSVLERLTQAGGKVLRLGAPPDTVTLTHYAEYLADVPNKVRVVRPYRCARRGLLQVESLDDDEGIGSWEGGDYFPQIWLDFRASGLARVGPVGQVEAELFSAPAFVDFAVDWMGRARWR